MNQAVTAQEGIAAWEWIMGQVKPAELCKRMGISKPLRILRDNGRDDIRSDVALDSELSGAEPGKVATRDIEERPDAESFKQQGQLRS